MNTKEKLNCCLALPFWFYKIFLLLIFLIIVGIIVWALLLDKEASNPPVPPKPTPKAEVLFAKSNIPGSSYGSVVDSQDNVYITGYYFSANAIDLNGDSSVVLPSSVFSAFVVKYDSSGRALLAKSFECDNGCSPFNIVLDSNENFIISGTYNSSVVVDINGDASKVLPATSGQTYIFLVKYNPSGIAILSKSIYGTLNQYSTPAIDSSDNIYITGNYNSNIVIDLNGDASVTLPINQFAGSCFLIKYNQSGTAIFAKSFPNASATSSGVGNGISLDSSDNIYITGHYNSDSVIDLNGDASVNLPDTNGISDFSSFLIKYNQSGTAIFANTLLADIRSVGQNVKVDSQNKIFITGYYQSNNIVYLKPDNSIALPANIYPSIFLISYNSNNGEVLAASSIQGNVLTPLSYGECLTIDKNNNIYISGSYASNSDIYLSNNVFLQAAPPGPLNSSSVFFVSYDSNFVPLYTKSIIGAEESSGNSIVIDSQDNLYLNGVYISDQNVSLNSEGTIILPITVGGNPYAYLIKYENLV